MPEHGERARQESSALRVVHRDWPTPLTRPAMANTEDRHDGVGLTNRFVEFDGVPVIPVSGEIHYSRVPRVHWEERLRLMRSGGITVIATYVFWIHHEPERGEVSFDDGLDVAAFVALCAELGFDVILRIGPWCHGEVRNGGFPDWVQAAPVRHRTDDPAYIALVEEWFLRLGAELAPLCQPDGRVIGIQLENELYDQPEHLLTLKAMARRAGLAAPLWTATAWGGAELPVGAVFPLYGGYADGFWVDADQPWDPTFRSHYLPSHEWDDPGIGADVRAAAGAPLDAGAAGAVHRTPVSPDFPIATCELGGGMATAYHRRPVLSADDIAAVANTKLGNGSAWQGYYMYAGGTNPRGPAGASGLQESQATGYPNDLPVFDYDFCAPIGAAGNLAPTHAALRRQHAFLAAVGDRLATMSSSLPERLPHGVTDATTLRWSLRSDGDAAFVVLSWHQPYDPLEAVPGVRFSLELDAETIAFPSHPIDVPAGTIARWPVNFALGRARVRWATASVLTLLPGVVDRTAPTLVLQAERGVPVELATDAGVRTIDMSTPQLVVLGDGADAPRVLVLPAAAAPDIWVLDPIGPLPSARSPRTERSDRPKRPGSPNPARQLLRSAAPLWLTDDGRVVARSGAAPIVERFDESAGVFSPVELAGTAPASATRELSVRLLRAASPNPALPDSVGGRASAPSHADVLRLGDAYAVDVSTEAAGASASAPARRTLEIDWAGDVAVLTVGGRIVADRFWDGEPWLLDLDDLEAAAHAAAGAPVHAAAVADVAIHILPLRPDVPIWLPPTAEQRRSSGVGALHSLDRVRLHQSTLWEESAGSSPQQ